MQTRNTAVPAALLASCLAATAPALADLAPGAFASRNPAIGTYESDEDYGTGPGIYQASVTDASASLNWTIDGAYFSGSCAGSALATCRSQGIATFSLASASTFGITYSFSSMLATANQEGWALVDLASGDTVAALSIDGFAFSTTGGVRELASDSFSMDRAAGNYLLAVLAEAAGSSGTFTVSAAFTPVPTPGALATLLVAAAVRSRRRR